MNPWIGSNLSAILSGLMIVGKISSGYLSDYVGRANVTFICILMTGVMCLAVWLTATTAASVWAFAALFGLFGGGYMTMLPAVLAQVVGLEEIEPSNGLVWFLFVWIYDEQCSHISDLYSFTISFFLGGFSEVSLGRLSRLLSSMRMGLMVHDMTMPLSTLACLWSFPVYWLSLSEFCKAASIRSVKSENVFVGYYISFFLYMLFISSSKPYYAQKRKKNVP